MSPPDDADQTEQQDSPSTIQPDPPKSMPEEDGEPSRQSPYEQAKTNIRQAAIGDDGVRGYSGRFNRRDGSRKGQAEQIDRAWDSNERPSQKVSGTVKQQGRKEQSRNVQSGTGDDLLGLSLREAGNGQRVGAEPNPVEPPAQKPKPLVPPYYKPPPVNVTATEAERDMAELSRPKPLDIEAEANKYIAKFRKASAQMDAAYGQDSLNSQRQDA
jgi:hypothetical protein